MPYIERADCTRLHILPGSLLEGTFVPQASTPPHVEDHSWAQIRFRGPATADQFKRALTQQLFPSVSEGFEVSLGDGTKKLPPGYAGPRSLITIQVHPSAVSLKRDGYNEGAIRVHFTDSSGAEFRYMPLTDLGFHTHAQQLLGLGRLSEVNSFIHRQREVFLRIGLSRPWARDQGDPVVCWVQVNGIYTFPDFVEEIRSYK